MKNRLFTAFDEEGEIERGFQMLLRTLLMSYDEPYFIDQHLIRGG